MPFSTLSGFKHAGEAEQRERNPRHVGRIGGDKSKGKEKHPQTVLRKASLTERAGTMFWAGEKWRERQTQSKIDRQIAPN